MDLDRNPEDTIFSYNQADLHDNRTSRRFVFTLFLDLLPEHTNLEDILDKTTVTYYVYQHELCPTTGRHHIQGYFELACSRRPSGARGLAFNQSRVPADCDIYIRRARKSREDNARYCTKPGARLAGPFLYDPGCHQDSNRGTQSNLNRFISDVRRNGILSAVSKDPSTFVRCFRGIRELLLFDLAERFGNVFRRVEVHVFCGDPGTGKTRRVYSECGGEPGPDSGPVEPGSDPRRIYPLFSCSPEWWDGYTGQPVVLIDDFGGDIQFRRLLRILDGHPLILPIKAGCCWAAYDTVYITTNLLPLDWYKKLFDLHPICYQALKRRISKFIMFYNDGTEIETELE